MAGLTPDQIEANFADLDFTQGIRKQIVEAIAPSAIKDKDPEMLDKTMKALDGLDKVSLGRLKLNEKAKENQTRADESEALAKYLIAQAAQRTDQGLPPRTSSDVAQRGLPQANKPAISSDERDQSSTTENTNEFKARLGKT